jgi:hypothetical protein
MKKFICILMLTFSLNHCSIDTMDLVNLGVSVVTSMEDKNDNK